MKSENDFAYKSAHELVNLLASKSLSSVELLKATISRIETHDPKINAIVVRDFERAYLEAKAADEKIAKGERLPLLGLPITIKESFSVVGLPSTWGNIEYKDYYPDEDALVVTRLKSAGAIIIGKTNVPWMLRDWQTYNEVYGTTNNPFNLNLTPGGSSGGSAAALAAGFVSMELGSDLAGSLRVPAHYCGVFAHKPTENIIPTRGAAPPGMPPTANRVDLAVAGPLARTAQDLRLALDVLAGPDERLEGKGYKLALPPARHKDLKNFRVLVIDHHPLFPTAEVIKKSIDNLMKELEKRGATVATYNTQMPDLTQIAHCYAFFFSAFLTARMPNHEYENAKMAAAQLSQDDDSLIAHRLQGILSSHRDWLIESHERGKLRDEWRNLYNNYDVIICPVMPSVAFPHDHTDIMERQIKIDGVLYPYRNQFVWASMATLFGLPATIAPIGQTAEGLPIGVQIIGDYFEDLTTIKFASLLEQELLAKSFRAI